MLTLSLLRHAKSSWSDARLKDFDRPINDRGARDAPRMGAFMARHGLVPDLILCSPAVRARQTLDLVLPHLARTPAVAYDDDLYLASSATLLGRVRAADAGVRHVLVVAHDPGLQTLALLLAGAGREQDMQALADKFPTAGLAVLAFAARAWPEVGEGGGRLKLFMTPRRLPSTEGAVAY